MSHNSINVLRRGLSDLSIVEKVRLIGEKAKTHTCRYLKTLERSINLALYAWIVIERVTVEVAELKDISL